MPSTPNDLGAVLTGGATPTTANSLLKGVLAGLSQGRSRGTDSRSDSSDFASMLDLPASEEELTQGSGKKAPHLLGQATVEKAGKLAEFVRCVLTAETGAMSVVNSGIRGIVSGLEQAVVPAQTAPTSVQATIITAVQPETTGNSAELNFNPHSAAMVLPRAECATLIVGELVVDNQETVTTGFSGANNLTGPANGESAAGENVAVASTPSASAIVLPSNTATTYNVESSEAEETTPAVEAPADNSSAEPTKENPAAPAVTGKPRAKGLRAHAMLHRPAGQYFERTNELLPSVKTHGCAVVATDVATPVTAEQPLEGASIPAEIRRELVETIAALLAPLWSVLPNVLVQAPPAVAPANSEGDFASAAGSENTTGTAITIKLGSRLPFTIELPLAASSTQTDALTQSPNSAPAEGKEAALSEPPVSSVFQVRSAVRNKMEITVPEVASMKMPELDSVLAKVLPLDFRIQLRTKIEAALEKAVPSLPAAFPPESTSIGGEGESDTSSFSRGDGRLNFEGAKYVAPSVVNPGLAFRAGVRMEPVQPLPVTAEKSATNPVEVKIDMPGLGSVTAEIATSQPFAISSEKKPIVRFGRAEKNAGDFKSSAATGGKENIESEKTFLSAGGQILKAKPSDAGTAVAKLEDNMPAQFTSRRLSVDPLELPPRFNARGDLLPGLNETPRFAMDAEIAEPATPAPELAHRAVETIMNVVDAQRNGSANASSVNLHFKFGGDDLSVRVQMRGSEVLTQFLTDSAELRSALSSEWQNLAGQGGASGLRLLDPTILPASAGVSTGFGSTSQGQGHSQQQQQAHHQQAQAAAAFPELRSLLRGTANSASAATEVAPRGSIAQPTSHHLTALA